MGQKIKSIRTKYRSNINEKCCAKNSIKKIPESAIATFLAIDDFNNADCAIRFNNLFYE
jgi:hypothetical protein